MSEKDRSVLKHILKYCVEIDEELDEINNDKTKYLESKVYRNSLALCVLQIGELVGLLTDEFKNENQEVEWKQIKGMRNVVAHKYGTFDFDVLWETVTENIPELRDFCVNKINEVVS